MIRGGGEFEVVGPAAVAGQSGGGRGSVTTYFYAEFSKPLGEYSVFQGGLITDVRRQLFLRIDDNYFSRSTTITF